MKFARSRAEILQLHHLQVGIGAAFDALEAVVAVWGGVLEREGASHLRVIRPYHASARVEQRPVRLVVRAVELPFRGPPVPGFRPAIHVVAVHDSSCAEVVVHLKRKVGGFHDEAFVVVRAGSCIVVVEEVGRL